MLVDKWMLLIPKAGTEGHKCTCQPPFVVIHPFAHLQLKFFSLL